MMTYETAATAGRGSARRPFGYEVSAVYRDPVHVGSCLAAPRTAKREDEPPAKPREPCYHGSTLALYEGCYESELPQGSAKLVSFVEDFVRQDLRLRSGVVRWFRLARLEDDRPTFRDQSQTLGWLDPDGVTIWVRAVAPSAELAGTVAEELKHAAQHRAQGPVNGDRERREAEAACYAAWIEEKVRVIPLGSGEFFMRFY